MSSTFVKTFTVVFSRNLAREPELPTFLDALKFEQQRNSSKTKLKYRCNRSMCTNRLPQITVHVVFCTSAIFIKLRNKTLIFQSHNCNKHSLNG